MPAMIPEPIPIVHQEERVVERASYRKVEDVIPGKLVVFTDEAFNGMTTELRDELEVEISAVGSSSS